MSVPGSVVRAIVASIVPVRGRESARGLVSAPGWLAYCACAAAAAGRVGGGCGGGCCRCVAGVGWTVVGAGVGDVEAVVGGGAAAGCVAGGGGRERAGGDFGVVDADASPARRHDGVLRRV